MTTNRPKRKRRCWRDAVFDITELISQFRLSGVDFTALVERERKNIEALAEVNRMLLRLA